MPTQGDLGRFSGLMLGPVPRLVLNQPKHGWFHSEGDPFEFLVEHR